jgi:hypothetical protein
VAVPIRRHRGQAAVGRRLRAKAPSLAVTGAFFRLVPSAGYAGYPWRRCRVHRRWCWASCRWAPGCRPRRAWRRVRMRRMGRAAGCHDNRKQGFSGINRGSGQSFRKCVSPQN